MLALAYYRDQVSDRIKCLARLHMIRRFPQPVCDHLTTTCDCDEQSNAVTARIRTNSLSFKLLRPDRTSSLSQKPHRISNTNPPPHSHIMADMLGQGGLANGFPLEQWFWETPPLTRWWTTSAVVCSILVQCHIVSPFNLFYSVRAVFSKGQVHTVQSTAKRI